MYEQRNFMIFPVTELAKVDFALVLETSAETITKSADGIKTFVKWDGEQPAFIDNLVGAEGAYTYSEMLAILATEAWQRSIDY